MATRKRTRARRASTSPRLRAKSGGQQTELVVYVHGIGQRAKGDELKREWDLALFGQDRGDFTRMAYWADIVRPTSTTAAIGTRDAGDDIDIDRILAQAGVDPDSEAAQTMAREFAHAFGIDGAAGRGVRKKILPLPGFLRKPIARAFIKALIGDTAAYFFAKGIREKVQQKLLDELPADGTPVTIVSHSQGTIISFEVLAALRPKLNITEWVTLGSPLGIREIQDFLKPGKLSVPKPVADNGRWHNFADPLDPVALDKGLSNEFNPTGFVRDDIIINRSTWRIDGFNPHSAAGYLAHPKVRKVVHEAIRFDSMGRFVVARDVAEAQMSDARQPVLIEVLEPGYGALDEDQHDTNDFEAKELRATGATPAAPLQLRDRIARAAKELEGIVTTHNLPAARIDTLRRFVTAHLTAGELREVAARHAEMRVYAVWRSAQKRKLLHRSGRVMQTDAAGTSYSANGADITWAVLDTGVRGTHPHFADAKTKRDNIVALWDCTKPGPPIRVVDLDKGDRDGHGTHVCGIIAGASPPAADKVRNGIAPLTKLIVYKVLNDKGEGEDAWIIKALDHIAEQNENSAELVIHGLNLSLGGPYDATVYGCGFTPICQELRRLWRSGVLVCIASGNEGQLEVKTTDGDTEINTPMSIGDPANLEDCIAVGSVNADKPNLYGVSSFSSRGPTSDGRVKPDVVAPGERISSCNSRFKALPGGGYDALYYAESGTSMATPHVSGLLAAFLSVRREFRGRPDEVKELLLRTCNDIGRDRYHQGRGIPNLMKMLLEA